MDKIDEGRNVLDIYYIVKEHMRMKVFDKMKWTKDKLSKFRVSKTKEIFTNYGHRWKKMKKLVESIVKDLLDEEDKPKIKKVVGIYGGRYQPFEATPLQNLQMVEVKGR